MDILRVAGVLAVSVLLWLSWGIQELSEQQQQRQRQQAGALLLAITVPRSHRLTLRVIGSVILVTPLFLYQLCILLNINPEVVRNPWLFAGLVAGTLGFWFNSFVDVEIREGGIWLTTQLIPWSHIQSYQWSEKNPNRLVLHFRKRLGLRRKMQLSISLQQQLPVEQILQQKLN